MAPMPQARERAGCSPTALCIYSNITSVTPYSDHTRYINERRISSKAPWIILIRQSVSSLQLRELFIKQSLEAKWLECYTVSNEVLT